jgi:hypothetical protein
MFLNFESALTSIKFTILSQKEALTNYQMNFIHAPRTKKYAD